MLLHLGSTGFCLDSQGQGQQTLLGCIVMAVAIAILAMLAEVMAEVCALSVRVYDGTNLQVVSCGPLSSQAGSTGRVASGGNELHSILAWCKCCARAAW